MAGPIQAPYSFLEDLNSPNLHSQLSPEELDEIAADPNANPSESDSSSSSDSEQDEVANANDESISNEKASSGLTVSHDYFGFLYAKSLFSLLVIGWNLPLANEKSQQKIYRTLKPIALRQYQLTDLMLR